MKGASTIFLVLGLIYFRLQPAAADEFDAIADIVAKPAVRIEQRKGTSTG